MPSGLLSRWASLRPFPPPGGEIVDRYGRNLVTNQVVYQVTLNTNLMGEDQNRILLELIHTAQEHGVTWPDNLPLTTEDPCFFNIGSVSEGSRKNYVKLSGELGWKETKGPALLAELRKFYGMDKDISDADARLLAGVRYELSLRTKEITWAAYVFATDVDMDFISAVRERSLAGVVISPVTTRKYSTTYAAHILGRTTRMDAEDWKIYKEKGYAMNETVGKDGVERAFESLLRGQAGKGAVQVEVRRVDEFQHISPRFATPCTRPPTAGSWRSTAPAPRRSARWRCCRCRRRGRRCRTASGTRPGRPSRPPAGRRSTRRPRRGR